MKTRKLLEANEFRENSPGRNKAEEGKEKVDITGSNKADEEETKEK